jgi:hypothetical protein
MTRKEQKDQANYLNLIQTFLGLDRQEDMSLFDFAKEEARRETAKMQDNLYRKVTK